MKTSVRSNPQVDFEQLRADLERLRKVAHELQRQQARPPKKLRSKPPGKTPGKSSGSTRTLIVAAVLAVACVGTGGGVVKVTTSHTKARTADTAAAPTAKAKVALAFAADQIGKPYRWGGAGPGAFDCSGLVMASWAAAGVHLPRTTFEQWKIGRHIPSGEEQPGDLVFFHSGPGDGPGHPGHVALVVKKGSMVEARCTLCGPIKRTSYLDRTNVAGFVRPTT